MSFMPVKWEDCVIKKAEESKRNLEKEKTPGQKKKKEKEKKPKQPVRGNIGYKSKLKDLLLESPISKPCVSFAVQGGLTLEKLTLKQYCYPINMNKCWWFNF